MSKSKIFLYLSLSFILGIVISSYYNFPSVFYGLVFSLSIILLTVWRKVSVVKILGGCLLFFAFGVWRFSIATPADDNSNYLKFYNNKELEIKGLIIAEPDIRKDKIKLTMEADEVKSSDDHGWRKVKGKFLITVLRFPEYKYGDFVEVKCQLKTPAEFDDFSYKNYLAKDDIYSVCYYPEIELLASNEGNFILSNVYKAKSKSKETLEKILTEPHASFLSGMILGVKQGIPKDIIDAFNSTGTSHIIVISGLHITIVAGLLMYLAQASSLSRKHSFWFAVFGLLFFIILTGVRPSSIRAGIMGGLVLLALNSGRLSDSKNAIFLAASIMLLVNPKVLRFDVGFQLSFLATVGIIYLSPYIEKLLKFLPKAFKIQEAANMTVSAQILTLPVIIYNFERVSLVSPLVNILVVPLIPLTIITGLISLILGIVWNLLGEVSSIIVWSLLQYELFIVDIFSEIPYASLEIEKIWIGWIVIYYIFIALFILKLKRMDKINI